MLQQPYIAALALVGIFLVYALVSAYIQQRTGHPWSPIATGLKGIIEAFNLLSSPLLAVIVVAGGCVFDLTCKRYGLASDSANQIIGAGLGLLTGQGAAAIKEQLKELKAKEPPAPVPPETTPPAPPASGENPPSAG